MKNSSDRFLKRLSKVADVVAAEKPQLHFFGLVHRAEGPPDRWDLLVASDRLAPGSFESIKYIVGLLKKELADQDMIRISQVVALPRDSEIIAGLTEGDDAGSFVVRRSRPETDQAVVLWPKRDSLRPARSA